MYNLKSDRRRGTLELCAMQEYAILSSRKIATLKMIREVEAEEKKEVPFTKDLKKYLDTLEVGLKQWFGLYKNLVGDATLDRKRFENMLSRKNYL